MTSDTIARSYENLVELNYQLYNGLFLTLPLDAVEQTGLLLPLLEEACHKGLAAGQNPRQIIEDFLATHRPHFSDDDRAQFLFKVIQYVERQIVLVDALEDAAFTKIHQTKARNELRKLIDRVSADGLDDELQGLLAEFSARVILTAHPTQFYPGPVLAIITDLTEAIESKDINRARNLLQQLGNTPFFNKEKPSPFDEAVSLTWYLAHIFYPSISEIGDRLARDCGGYGNLNKQLLSVGFWPGGDRDGNPFVTTETTAAVANKLRNLLISCYHADVRKLKYRLSFRGVLERLEAIEHLLHEELVNETQYCYATVEELLAELEAIEKIVAEQYQGLFLDRLRSFIHRVRCFGFHFASLDIRQDSRVLAGVLAQVREVHPGLFPEDFDELDSNQKVACLLDLDATMAIEGFDDPLVKDTLESLRLVQTIQRQNGELGCHRYVISNCGRAEDVAGLMTMFRLVGWEKDQLSVDIVPLFETVKDLEQAGAIMEQLYTQDAYMAHLQRRDHKQTVMLGFSDGTKDGGYLMANWAIFCAKEELTAVSRAHGVEIAFFDGRGGPPARGGGNTYRFYAALGKKIESNQIQLTVQGQTVSSYYGTEDAAIHNLRQLLAAGLENNLYDRPERELNEAQRALLGEMADISYRAYQEFKAHPLFLPYLQEMSTMNYYAQSNIGSRPSKRGGGGDLKFEDLRAIPFVGAWGQLKQNVPGYFGFGTALKEMERAGRLQECQDLYKQSRFFRALLDNSMQSMSKANFELTAHMGSHERFGEFWQLIRDEFELSKAMTLQVSGQSVLLEDNPGSRHSIALRQRVVLPLLVIQQYALMELQSADKKDAERFEKMVIRSMFGNINASRNSA